jgi:uncharacterized protein YnzC (UPF0291/DUF896 family)
MANGDSKTLKFDPSFNVRELVGLEVKRIDDLRIAETTRVDERLGCEKGHVREVMELRADYDEKLREAEAKRIDAIRVVDVQAVSVANDKATQQASILATQVSTSAETLRALVASNATAIAAQLTQIITPITDRLGLLEKAQYTGAGKEGVTDPMMTKLFEKIDNLVSTQKENTGKSLGLNQGWVYVLGSTGLIATIITILAFVTGHIH